MKITKSTVILSGLMISISFISGCSSVQDTMINQQEMKSTEMKQHSVDKTAHMSKMNPSEMMQNSDEKSMDMKDMKPENTSMEMMKEDKQ